MIATWWRNFRRRRILAKSFPDDWEPFLHANVRQFASLSSEDQAGLRRRVQILVAEKYWEGCGGLTITDEIRVTIAGQASLLLLGWNGPCFDHLKSILVYPDTYLVPEKQTLPGGIVDESMQVRLGEAWYRGPVILAWSHVNRHDAPGEVGRNVVLHEFAHVLDHADDSYDGTPTLETKEQYVTWRKVMSHEFHRLQRDAAHGRATLLDTYGTQNESEFFAVATECFFEQPVELAELHPRLYELLRDYFRQDPAG